MLTKDQARAKIVELISDKQSSNDLVVLDDETLEYDWGWVFFYQSKKFIETGDFLDMVYGNAPYIVNRITGEIVVTGTAGPIENYIQDYESRFLVAVTAVDSDWTTRAITQVRNETGISLADATKMIRDMPSEVKSRLSEVEAQDLAERLRAQRLTVEIRTKYPPS